jgi:hypothetical protein
MPTKKTGLLLAALIIFLAACQPGQETKTSNTASTEQSNFHKIVVQEVLQASEYTYLHGKGSSNDVWLAVPSMQAKNGDTYYYEGGIEMKKFESKDLNRTFESVVLLEKLYSQPDSSAAVATNKPVADATYEQPASPHQDPAPATSENYKRKATPPEKKEVNIKPAPGGITIAKLFGDKDAYAGKTVKIKGQVVKYTPAVMNKNWIHIQDGTNLNGKFDLAVTSKQEVKVGDIVTFEGKVSLNKDLGYGYFFDVIMEDAEVK